MAAEAGREVASVHARLADAETGLHEARRKVATQQYEANQVISHARCSMTLEGVAGLALGQQQLQR